VDGDHEQPHERLAHGPHPSEALAEMAVNLQRIRQSWEAQVEELKRACDLSNELRAQTAQLRKRRAAPRGG
jgi:hypothetical protein